MVKPIGPAMVALACGLASTSSALAVDLPSGTVDRAVVCFVYGGFAPRDARSLAAKAAIDQTIESAVASGVTTREQVKEQTYDTIALAMYEEPRAELIAIWNECRDSFAP